MVSKFEIKKRNIPVRGTTKPENRTGGLVLNIGSTANVSDQFLDGDAIFASLRSVSDLVNAYRNMLLIPEVDFAVSEIVNESVIVEGDNKVVNVKIDNEVDEELAKSIIKVWDKVYSRLKIHNNIYEWFQRWYVDSRLYFEKIRADNGQIIAIRYIDPRKIIRVRLYSTDDEYSNSSYILNEEGQKLYIVDDFYFYTDHVVHNLVDDLGSIRYIDAENFYANYGDEGRRMEPFDIIYIHSDLVDSSTGVVYGYLHKAMKAANMLSNLEDFAIVHKLSRAQSRLAFYVDVGNLPVQEAMAHLKQQAAKYKNRYEYDPKTGKVMNIKGPVPMVEDFWFLRFNGSRGTEVQTISGDESGAVTTDEIQLFREKLMMALNVPISRFSTETASIVLGTHEEITREELKFSNFIRRLRNIFNRVFDNILKEELIALKIIKPQEYNLYKRHIFWDWAENSYYQEVKNLNIMMKKVGAAAEVVNLGFYPQQWIMENIMGHSKEEIEEIEKMREKESDGAAGPSLPSESPPEETSKETGPSNEEK